VPGLNDPLDSTAQMGYCYSSGGQKRQYGLEGVPIFSGTTAGDETGAGDEAGTGCVVVESTPLTAAACSTGIGVGGVGAVCSTVVGSGGGGVKTLPVSSLYRLCKALLFGASCNACSNAVMDFDG